MAVRLREVRVKPLGVTVGEVEDKKFFNTPGEKVEEKKERTLDDKLAKRRKGHWCTHWLKELKTLEVKELLYTLAEIEA